MKKLLLDIKNAIADFGAENIDFAHYVHLYRTPYTKDGISPEIQVGPWHSYPKKSIEAELLLTQTPEGPQFDEATAREWLESLNLNLPEDNTAFDEHVKDLKARGVPVATSSAEFENLVNPIGSSLKDLNPLKEIAPEEMDKLKDEFRAGNSSAQLEAEAEKIRLIIYSVKKGHDISGRRYEALRAAGYTITNKGNVKNFGRSGTVKVQNGEILAQFACNTGYRNCIVYIISKQS